ncbi:hypothetical protein [Streptomyces sp. G-G2]|uniref:hypothetical protein n=1 Tax=Streptomyces sp. G-G2 TaxID=3046201 RepID=UPI0024B9A10B|nr:hypothetical protein [Streptomyces sp. G-G2]MDJ0382261.1 hypothetical protein [Streptomyces sp. G-G2]
MTHLVRSTKSSAAALVTAPLGRLAAQAVLALGLVSAAGFALSVAPVVVQDGAIVASARTLADDPWSSAPLTKSDDPGSRTRVVMKDDPWS